MKIGSICKDTVTGFQGAVMAHTTYLHNCDRYTLQPREMHEGSPVGAKDFEGPRIEFVSKGTWDAANPPRQRAFDLGDIRAVAKPSNPVTRSRTDWDAGCDRWSVQAQKLKDGKPLRLQVFDGDHLELVKKNVERLAPIRTGGPMPQPRRK